MQQHNYIQQGQRHQMRDHQIITVVVTPAFRNIIVLNPYFTKAFSLGVDREFKTSIIFTWTGIASNWAAGSLDVTMRAVRHTILMIMICVLVTGDPCTSPFEQFPCLTWLQVAVQSK